MLRVGSKGPDVVAWQKVVGVTPDGDFGPKTDAATRAWQRAHGLTPDGIVGPKTLAAASTPVPAYPPSPVALRPAVAANFVAFTQPLEGSVPWMYLDVKGLVTVAIGNLIDPIGHALPLPFVRADGTPATEQEIRDEWTLIKSNQQLARQGHRAAKAIARLRLTPEGIERVVAAKRDEMVAYLERRFPQWRTWPADAQLATLSMSWACGPAFRFGTLANALYAQNFTIAAASCEINSTGNPGVIPRNVLNRQLYENAARVKREGLDPDVLLWHP